MEELGGEEIRTVNIIGKGVEFSPSTGGSVEEQEEKLDRTGDKKKFQDPGSQIQGLFQDQEEGKLDRVAGTSPKPHQVVKPSLDSCFVDVIGIGK